MCCKEEMSYIWHNIAYSHDNSCDRTVAKQRVSANPFESPVAMMRGGFQCVALLAK